MSLVGSIIQSSGGGNAQETALNAASLVVASATNLQDFADRVDHALLKARGTGVSTSYVSTVAVGGTTFAQPAFDGEISSDQGYFHESYAGATGLTVANLAASSTYVYLDNAGVLQQQTSIPTRQDWSRKIFTMRIGVNTSTNTIIGFEYFNNPIGHYANSIRDIYEYLLAQGVPFKKGQTITGRAADLGFDVSAGTLLEFGGTGDINNPNIRTFDQADDVGYNLMSRTALVSAETELVKFWDNAGTITALGSTTLVGHRLYRFSSGNFALQYGQGNYANMALAKSGVLTEDYVVNPDLTDATFFGWWFIQSTATDTSGTTLTDFIEYTIGVQGGSSSSLFPTGASGIIGEEAGSTAPNADANKKRLFLDTEKNNLLTAIDQYGVLTVIDEFIDTPQTTAANLETNFPATSNNSAFAWVAGTTSDNGLYLSDGSTWVKQLDNSGDISTLFDWAGGISYTGTNLLSSAGVASFRNSADDADQSINTGSAAGVFDGNTGVRNDFFVSEGIPALLYNVYTSLPPAAGQFTFYVGPSVTANSNMREFEIIGRTSGGAVETIVPSSVVRSGAGSVSLGAGTNGTSKVILATDMVANENVTVNTPNTIQYAGYGIRIITGGAIYGVFAELEGLETVSSTASITPVRSINKLHAGVSKIEPTALTADTLLDDTAGTVLLDPSGADFTMTLPAVATVLTGKKYTFVLTTAPATTAVTLDGASAETINGATTNATALTSQWDTVTVMSDGTQWVIV